MKEIVVFGNTVLDILARPVDFLQLQNGTLPVKEIEMSFGGNALNEAVLLSRLGRKVKLISLVGEDEAGRRILDCLAENGIDDSSILKRKNLTTSINIVLIDEQGERYFLTNPNGSQRKQQISDLLPFLPDKPCLFSFTNLFVSPEIRIPELSDLFRHLKSDLGYVIALDLTKPKNGETIQDLKEMLAYIDYFFPNEAEIAMLTGIQDALENARLLVSMGVKCAVVKCGKAGCVAACRQGIYRIPAYPVDCIDSTGAGDNFAAAFLWAVSEGWDVYESACFANSAASVAVEKTGASGGVESLEQVMPRYEELLQKGKRL
ncbi:MAG: carbohydrate kinase family protein [Erysipelotrichaceae bacterium]|nr:carbohydrate kinase family protein [Erysipelotrichaceae bacterium]